MLKRGKKQDPYSQGKLILEVLKRGGEYFEEELGKITTGEFSRGARALVSVLRSKGYPVATKNRINSRTGRLNKCYYYEPDAERWIQYSQENVVSKFKKGPPTYREIKRKGNQLQLL